MPKHVAEVQKQFKIDKKTRQQLLKMLGIVDTLRTIYFRDIISHTPEIKTFKEQYSF